MQSVRISFWLALAIGIFTTGCNRAEPVDTGGPWNIEVTLIVDGESEPGDGLTVVFPEQEAHAYTQLVSVWALQPSGLTCNNLDNINPDRLLEYSLVLIDPSLQQNAILKSVPAGEVLFYFEGYNLHDYAAIRGCALENIQKSEPGLSVDLSWACRPEAEDELPDNDQDDDCDGLTDECEDDADCEDHDGCTTDFCTVNECHHTPLPDTLLCTDDDPCTTGDHCQRGECVGVMKDCIGFDGICVQSGCDSQSGACGPQPMEDGTACNDERFCTIGDVCTAGECGGSFNDCDDGDSCTHDVCDDFTDQCQNVLVPRPGEEGPQGSPTCANGLDDDCDGEIDEADPNCLDCANDSNCDDSNSCTDDLCVDGVCTNLAVVDGTLCDDQANCTEPDTCLAGACQGTPVDCSGQSGPCVQEGCQESTGLCEPVDVADGTPCEDGLFCTDGDTCRDGECSAGPDRDCSDDDLCTTDECIENLQFCKHTHTPNPGGEGPVDDATCENGVDDDCDFAVDGADPDCQHCTGDQDCDDSQPCTIDSCDVDGGCLHENETNGTSCSDGLVCTLNDECSDGVCNGMLTECDPATECMINVCQEPLGTCQESQAPDGANCDDEDDCTENDRCQGGACVSDPIDADHDGYQPPPCGLDCNDQLEDVNPDAPEGPAGNPTCSDTMDNDCDGATDSGDLGCFSINGTCSPDGWCWEHPLPQGNQLNGVWVFASGSAWAVGEAGTILQWQGVEWTAEASPTTENLNAVWGPDATIVWMVGDRGTSVNWRTGNFEIRDMIGSENFYGLWGLASSSILAVGGQGQVRIWDGSEWTVMTPAESETLRGIWGTSPSNFWVVGDNGLISQWTGSWSDSGSTGHTLRAIHGTSSTYIFAAGDQGRIRHYNGTIWTDDNISGNALTGVFVTPEDDIWAVSSTPGFYHLDTIWTEIQTGATAALNAIHGTGSNNIWAVGPAGAMLHFDGATWNDHGFNATGAEFRDIWASSAEDIWVVGDGQLARYDGTGWSFEEAGSQNGVWGMASDDVWVVGDYVLQHWNGQQWQVVHPGVGDYTLNDVYGFDENSIVAVGQVDDGYLVMEWDGVDWLEVPGPAGDGQLHGIWGVSADEFWAVGEDSENEGVIWHYQLTEWTDQAPAGSFPVRAIWGAQGNMIFAVGDLGKWYHFAGLDWAMQDTQPNPDELNFFYGIRGTSSTDVWAVGVNNGRGVIYHYNGTDWTPQSSGCASILRQVLPVPTDGVLVVGGNGAILKRP